MPLLSDKEEWEYEDDPEKRKMMAKENSKKLALKIFVASIVSASVAGGIFYLKSKKEKKQNK